MSAEFGKSAVPFSGTAPRTRDIANYERELEAAGELTPPVAEAIEKAKAVRAGYGIVFYIAGALTGVSEEVKQRYTQTSETIERFNNPYIHRNRKMFGYAPHLHGTDPVKHPNVTPREVRNIDYLWATQVADGHFNFLDPMAHGNAIEAAWAEEYNIPGIFLAPEGLVVSRLTRGLKAWAHTITYENFEREGIDKVSEFLYDLQETLFHNGSLKFIHQNGLVGENSTRQELAHRRQTTADVYPDHQP